MADNNEVMQEAETAEHVGGFVDIFTTEKKYDVIYADPPWSYADSGCSGNAAEHYNTMTAADIAALQKAVDNSADIEEALQKVCFFGLGRWTRGNSECCLLAIKGKPHRVSASVGQLIFSTLRRHSEKPAETRGKIEKLMGGGAFIELFARQAADGWDCWGNEV